jgi:hypothetical protein
MQQGNITDPSLDPSLIISILALIFTVVSFWWMNWRRGKLVVFEPRTYALSSTDNHIIIDLPLVFLNKGAATRVVRNLKLIVTQENTSVVMYFNNTTSDLGIVENKQNKWARAFPIPGRESYSRVFNFVNSQTSLQFVSGEAKLELKVIADGKDSWKKLLEFTVLISEDNVSKINSSSFIPYDNNPDPYSID